MSGTIEHIGERSKQMLQNDFSSISSQLLENQNGPLLQNTYSDKTKNGIFLVEYLQKTGGDAVLGYWLHGHLYQIQSSLASTILHLLK